MHPVVIDGPALLVVASDVEAASIGAEDILGWRRTRLNDRLDVVIAGVGKANAAAAAALAIQAAPTRCVLSVGIAGALPTSGLSLGDVVLGSSSLFADEGLVTPDGFQTCADMGFPLGPDGAETADADLIGRLTPLADAVGPIATVSTCSGTDAAAAATEARTRALAEAMEGAAVLHVAARLKTPAAELRVISNTTGDRPRQQWDLAAALSRLTSLIGSL